MGAEMHRVKSTAIELVGYDPHDRSLTITFTGGATYAYLDVPPDVYDQLMAADSKGTFVNKVVKPAFRSVAQ